jgi:hypothetical protein
MPCYTILIEDGKTEVLIEVGDIRKVVDYIQTMELSISLQLNRRRSAGRGLERHPNHSAGGPPGRLAEPQK